MSDSSTIGARFEEASLKLFDQLFPLLGFEVIKRESRISGSQSGYDIRFETKPHGTSGVRVNFFIECKGAKDINRLTTSEYDGKPEQLHKSTFNPDYWILLSPLRYKNNDFQELLEVWKKSYPFGFVDWVREIKEDDKAGIYIDLFKHFPDIYEIFKEDVPENIRETIPEYTLEEILARLRKDINEAYDEFQNRVVLKGVIPGVRRITPQAIYKTKESDPVKLNKIRTNYYMLNSSDKSVWRTVCNEMDVPNTAFQPEIIKAVENKDAEVNTIWVLGASGCGKTTQMYRTAVDFAAREYPVVLVNSLDLDRTTNFVEYEKYFKQIHHLQNTSLKEKTPLLIFIDNPAARIEDVSQLLSRFDDLDEDDFECTFILFERVIRYRQAEEDNFLVDIAGNHSRKIYIETENEIFKRNVLGSFARALELPSDELNTAQQAFFENEHTTVAEGIINFCKKTDNKKYKEIVMDWVDYENLARDEQWNSLTDLYKWTSLIYQFGVAFPCSMLPKIINNYDKNEFYNLEDFFTKEELENLPLILEGNTLRTRHELIAQWHVDEKLKPTQYARLGDLLKAVDVQDALERSLYIALLGRKNIVRNYISNLDRKDLETILKNAADYTVTHRLALMAQGWIYFFRDELEQARDTFKSVLEVDAGFLPAIMETAKTDFLLGNDSEAERRLKDLLGNRPNDLHTRTELAKLYQLQKKYEKAVKTLRDLLNLDPQSIFARNELGKVYQVLERYNEAETILKQCIDISPRDLNSRTELGKVYQALERYDEAEKVLKECLSISPRDLNSRTELGKVYQALEKYDEAEKILLESLDIDEKQLHPRTELGKVYQALGRYDEAEKILLQALKINNKQLQPRTELGKVYQALERYDEAEKVLKECLSISPRDLNSRTELGKVYQALGRYDEAETILLEALKINNKQLQPRTELGKVYQALGRYDEAEKILLEALKINNKQLQPRTELGKVYQALGKYDEAEKVLLDLLELDKDNLQARTELGKVYQALGRYDEAEKVLLESLDIDEKQLHPRTEIARVYIHTGLFRKARVETVKFLEIKSESDKREIAHLLLTYLNACYQMKRYEDGVRLIDKYDAKFLSAQLAEEYGRLLRNYDLKKAVEFFQTAARKFSRSSRLLSEAAICLKLGGKAEAESMLEEAIRLEPKAERKYRDLYEYARLYRPTEYRYLDRTGIVINIDYKNMSGIVGSKTENYTFRWSERRKSPYNKLKINDEVFFDVTNRNYAINIEPIF